MTREARDRIASLNEITAQYYWEQLHAAAHDGPRRYLTGRGFGELLRETRWTVGYAPPGWTTLRDHLARAGYSDEAMLEAGLVSISRRGNPIDRFRDRITFGVRDHEARLVGFIARAAPSAQDGTPRYLNTPRTPAYNKGSVLFGLGEARDNHTAEATVLTEGPLDAIAVNLADRDRWAPVALCGTAFTPSQTNWIAELGRPVTAALDDDPAGHRALVEIVSALLPRLGEPRAARLGVGCDPAFLSNASSSLALNEALETAGPASEVVMSQMFGSWNEQALNPPRQLRYLREAARAIVKLGAPDPGQYASLLCRTLELEPRAVTDELIAALTATSIRARGPSA